MSEEDFLPKYKSLTNEQLFAIVSKPSHYTKEALKAAENVLHERGKSLDQALKEGEELKKKNLEYTELQAKVMQKLFAGELKEQIKLNLTSQYLSSSELDQLIDQLVTKWNLEQENLSIKNKTMGACIIGGLIGVLINTAIVLAVFYFFNTKSGFRYPLIALAGLFFVSYIPIHLFSKQNLKNTAVLITSFLSATLGITLGIVLYVFTNMV